jgi:hypothetical protein
MGRRLPERKVPKPYRLRFFLRREQGEPLCNFSGSKQPMWLLLARRRSWQRRCRADDGGFRRMHALVVENFLRKVNFQGHSSASFRRMPFLLCLLRIAVPAAEFR